jgi:hypothetical protein
MISVDTKTKDRSGEFREPRARMAAPPHTSSFISHPPFLFAVPCTARARLAKAGGAEPLAPNQGRCRPGEPPAARDPASDQP